MMAKKLRKTGLSQMQAKSVGGDPVAPAASPTTTQPMPKVVAQKMHTSKKVAKVGKKATAKAKPLNKPAVKKVKK